MRLTPTPELAALRDRFRDFADKEVAPHAARHDAEERVDRAIVGRLAAEGLLAPLLPAGLGGRGLDPIAYGLLHEEIGRACSSVRSLLTVHDMVADSVRRWGTPALRERWLPRLVSGEALGAFALSEPDAGSDAAAVATVARPGRDGGHHLLTGTKRWITFGQLADVFLVFARTPDEGPTAFLVARDRPGLSVEPLPGMLGTRGSMLAELRFDDCPVPRDHLLGAPGRAHPFITTSALTLGRYSVAAGSVGIVRACLEASAGYAAGRGVLQHQLVQRMVADMVVSAEAGRLLALRAGELIGAGSPHAPMAATEAKYFAGRAAADAARDAVQIHGAAGCSPDHPVARYYRDAKVMEIIEGGNEVSQTMIGRFGHTAGH
ncbi:acyl-CoA dehydrogenase family protein [Streptomyces sp. SL13]|uniref:Acyl-CoA dehydrogenase family protein n=1 Tax=Streptantibioticus silvisoli TaxID=2705255 RepID=A0AA90HG19_9ACTN|nr:acyl-CoA dehydrogenase family protein [Streptantibioticus silvisoli]MDI5966357.1 acyl-CoA dehydrogenase family protein [Streptantibioticus silvisoli]MDI5974272.1 acyl-CoA dehydrogenase family protein [Streptantibioticus silvisoli]